MFITPHFNECILIIWENVSNIYITSKKREICHLMLHE